MEQESLLNISEASRILGVSEAALRQWTDEGKIKAFITPGGHRRYLRAELKKFISSHSKMLGIKDLVTELEETVLIHRQIDKVSLEDRLWYNKIDQASQECFAVLGHRLLNLISKYISEPSKREENKRLVRAVGHDMGETLSRLNLPLIDSMEVFLLHREPVMNAAIHLMGRREAFTGRVVDAIPLVVRVMDEALVALVSAHQQYCHEIHEDTTGGNKI
ncbi:helix-turn-helix domain-containing protein [Chloroflexota bacterium]